MALELRILHTYKGMPSYLRQLLALETLEKLTQLMLYFIAKKSSKWFILAKR
jgi:hypothetical protein